MESPPDRSAHLGHLKTAWERRARENARRYIATTQWASEAEFAASGRVDVDAFFDGLEHLLHHEQIVLDIGCGIGRMDQHLAPRVRRLIGVDVAPEMVRQARERLAGLGNVEFLEVDGWNLRPIPDRSVHLVFSYIVFQHMPRAAAAGYAAEARRVLVPGGDFVFQVPEALGTSRPDPPDTDSFEMRFYVEEDLRSFLTGLGFVWAGVRRHRVDAPGGAFNHLRVHVRAPGAGEPARS